MIRKYYAFFYIFINFKIFCCGEMECCCCNKNNYKDNEFCFLPGDLDTSIVFSFMNNTNEVINKLERLTGIKLSKIYDLVNNSSKHKLKNKPKVVAIKNFIAFCEILFLLSRSYHLIKFLGEEINKIYYRDDENDRKKKEAFNTKKNEYVNFLDEAISKTLTKKINKNEKSTNINDLLKEVSKKCSDCFSIILYSYICGINEETVNKYNESDGEYLDCLVSYISNDPNLTI